jgi:hypothetical protein
VPARLPTIFHPIAFQATLKALEELYPELDERRIHAPLYTPHSMLTKLSHLKITDYQRYHPYMDSKPSTWEKEKAIECFRSQYLQKNRSSLP